MNLNIDGSMRQRWNLPAAGRVCDMQEGLARAVYRARASGYRIPAPYLPGPERRRRAARGRGAGTSRQHLMYAAQASVYDRHERLGRRSRVAPQTGRAARGAVEMF
jgi:hypothetical protein